MQLVGFRCLACEISNVPTSVGAVFCTGCGCLLGYTSQLSLSAVNKLPSMRMHPVYNVISTSVDLAPFQHPLLDKRALKREQQKQARREKARELRRRRP